jgi:hypothetical protein
MARASEREAFASQTAGVARSDTLRWRGSQIPAGALPSVVRRPTSRSLRSRESRPAQFSNKVREITARTPTRSLCSLAGVPAGALSDRELLCSRFSTHCFWVLVSSLWITKPPVGSYRVRNDQSTETGRLDGCDSRTAPTRLRTEYSFSNFVAFTPNSHYS